ncbi:MAG: tryptophan halogenase family protein [Woeseiaceae bacterium]|nr:tryptophan halogenase family protein [Woeseiaceae bacterium]
MLPIKKIQIVGGGTAGWMTANLMARRWAGSGIEISLLESPDIGIIGVGEGSTPQLKAFFDAIDVDEADWMPACKATYKVGITFRNWSEKPGFDHYFHPFPSEVDTRNFTPFVYNCFLRRQGIDVDAHPNRYFVTARLAEQSLGPKPDYNFPFRVLYGYHFDAHLLGEYLGRVAVQRGVRHVQGKVAEVRVGDDGAIAGLELDDGRSVHADLYVDCTGFRSLLLQRALGIEFEPFAANLFNDAAVVLPTPQGPNPNSQTISTALRNGWAWNIPLTHRVGNGYVYSSRYCSSDEAETELRSHLGLLDSDVEARHLRMRVGQVARHWHRNCVAVGLSQGFIEPLEATALHIVQDTVETFMSQFEKGAGSDRHLDDFNRHVRARFEGVRDYIVCHYRANSRTDSDYWRDNAANENLSDSLVRILKTWIERGDLSLEVREQDISHYYNTISWHCLLAGYGLFPDGPYRRPSSPADSRYPLADIEDYVTRCALNFRPHSEQLEAIMKPTA